MTIASFYSAVIDTIDQQFALGFHGGSILNHFNRPDTMHTFSDLPSESLKPLLHSYGLSVTTVKPGEDIPGSYWGNPEAGLIGSCLYVRPDTPVHSLLHESCHYICMPEDRRLTLNTDAGGDIAEENAVCYLQILLADKISGYNARLCMTDMDDWGYTFRLGSAENWFTQDAEDAKSWLIQHKLLFEFTGNLRHFSD